MTTLSNGNSNVFVCDVAARDGLQSEKRIWSVDERVELINRLANTGIRPVSYTHLTLPTTPYV